VFETLGQVAAQIFAENTTRYVYEEEGVSLYVQRVENYTYDVSTSFRAGSSFVVPSQVLREFQAGGVVFNQLGFQPFQTDNLNIIANLTGLSLLGNGGNIIQVDGASMSITINIPIAKNVTATNVTCIWWDESAKRWSGEGCVADSNVTDDRGYVTCKCDHLTNFTVAAEKPPTTPTPPERSGTDIMKIIVIVVPVVVGVMLIVAVIIAVFMLRRRRQKMELVAEISLLPAYPTEIVQYDQVQIQESIGQGVYGTIYKGLYQGTTRVALKRLDNENDLPKFLQEANIMKKLHHPNIVQFLGYYRDKTPAFYYMTEYITLGTLTSIMKGTTLTQEQVRTIAADVAAAVSYCHEKEVVHGDVAARNVLLSEGMTAKLSDFGMSLYSGLMHKRSSAILSDDKLLRWTSPELLNSGEYSYKSDVWAFGVFTWELMTNGQVPYAKMTSQEVCKHIQTGNHPSIPSEWPERIVTVLTSCWKRAEERPQMRSIHDMLSVKKKLQRKASSSGDFDSYQ